MKHTNRRSIQTLITSCFILFSLFLLSLTTGIVCRIQYRESRDDTIQTLRQTSLSVADSVNQHLNQMNQVSLNAISSQDLREAFSRYFSETLSAYEHQQERLHLASALTTAKGFDFSIRQLNLYTLEKGGFGAGESNGDRKTDVQEQTWYEKAVEEHGKPVVSVTGRTVSLSRMFFNNINVPLGYAEVQKEFDTVFSLAEDPGVSYPVDLYIYDKYGNRLYPSPAGDDASEESFDYYQLAGDEQILQTSASGKAEIICFARTEKLDLTVAVSAGRNVYLRQIYSFLFRILPVFFLAFILLIFLSVVISRQISSPIRHIYHFLSDETKDRFQLLDMDQTKGNIFALIDAAVTYIIKNIRWRVEMNRDGMH